MAICAGAAAALACALLSGCQGGRGGPPPLGIPVFVDFNTFTADLTVGPSVGALSGQVVSTRGLAVQGASVRISLPVSLEQVGLDSFTVVTSDLGLFCIGNIPRGIYDLTISHPEYFETTVQVPIVEGAVCARTFSLQPLSEAGEGGTPGETTPGGKTPGLAQPAGPDVIGRYAVQARLEFAQGPAGSVPTPVAEVVVTLNGAAVSSATVKINGRKLDYDGTRSAYRASDAFEFTPDGYYTLEINGGEIRVTVQAPHLFANLTTPAPGAQLSGPSMEVAWEPTGADSYALTGIPLTGNLDDPADDGAATFRLDTGDLAFVDMLRVTSTRVKTLLGGEDQGDVVFTLVTHLGIDVN